MNGVTVSVEEYCIRVDSHAGCFDRAGMDNNDLVGDISEPSGEGIADIYSALRFNGEHHLKFHSNLTQLSYSRS